jgi:hydrogenase expression/formation protein HypC
MGVFPLAKPSQQVFKIACPSFSVVVWAKEKDKKGGQEKRPEEKKSVNVHDDSSRHARSSRCWQMCLAVPARVLEIQGDVAKVDFGQEVLQDVNIVLVDVHVGEYVLVHAGYAIQVIDKKTAEETLLLWEELLTYDES